MNIIACPVAFHPDGVTRRIAVYRHPENGPQLITTSASTPVAATNAAAQALYTMSALETRAALPIGTSQDINADELWHFALCRIVPPVREEWKNLCPTSATLLHFSWMPLDTPLNDFSEPDMRALDWIKATL